VKWLVLTFVFLTLCLHTRCFALDFTAVLTDLDNAPLVTDQIPLTLSKIATTALLTPFQDEQNVSGEEKVRRFLLATKVREATDVQLTTEEVALIKKLIAKAYAPLIVGRAYQLLDPASVK